MYFRPLLASFATLLILLLAVPTLSIEHQSPESRNKQGQVRLSALYSVVHAQEQSTAAPALPAIIATVPAFGDPAVNQATDELPDLAAEVFTLINRERAVEGCPALVENATLKQVALNHSVDMAQNDYFAHDNLEGKGPGLRLTHAGYNWYTYAENIAAGYSTPQDVVDVWMVSEGHRRNILNCDLREGGIGVYYLQTSYFRTYWTLDIGTRPDDDIPPIPTSTPTATPTATPTSDPSAEPTIDPNPSPIGEPTGEPIVSPTPVTPIPIPEPFKYHLPAVQGMSATE